MLKYSTRHIVSCETLSSNQLIRKPPKRFCKQKISDNPEKRIVINDYILPLKRSMCYFFMTWSEVSHEVIWKEKFQQNLLQSKDAGLISFRWPVVLIDHNIFLQLLYPTHKGFPISERTHLTQVSITTLQFFTYPLSNAKPLKMSLSGAAEI